ncbi:MAG: DUF4214 domain-containing protein, partial [Lachnospiraceae bacterium]|nr:DUF4214 domain-containing protein [Lachnospiraceae bacterium]
YANLYNASDIDYYKFTVDKPGSMKLFIENNYAKTYAGWNFTLFDAGGKEYYSKMVRAINAETITSDEYWIPAGTYYIKVSASDDIDPTNYSIMAQVTFSEAAQIKAFVAGLYEVALDRTPDEAGLNDWSNRLQTGEAAAVNVVQGVLCSDEYKNKGKSNGEIVTDCYNAMLARDPDEGGYNDWVTRLDGGMSVNAIFAGFVGSEEFGNLCASYGINPGTYELTEARDMNTGITMFVSRLYTQALGRSFDANGLNDWCGQIIANPSREIILNISTNGFLNSQEFRNKGLDNTEYVKVLYRTYLGREYEESGLSDWVGQLDRGEKDRDAVAAGFAYSAEFSNIMASYGL